MAVKHAMLDRHANHLHISPEWTIGFATIGVNISDKRCAVFGQTVQTIHKEESPQNAGNKVDHLRKTLLKKYTTQYWN